MGPPMTSLLNLFSKIGGGGLKVQFYNSLPQKFNPRSQAPLGNSVTTLPLGF